MGIAHELITRGWHQGDFLGPDGSVCLYGACVAAALGAEFDSLDIDGVASASGSQPQEQALMTALTRVAGTVLVAEYNDAPERTFDEVLRVAKEADELLDL